MKSKVTVLLFSILCIATQAQIGKPWSFNEYLNSVKNKNLGLAAQKYNISIADADILTASIFPDPQIEVETSNNGIASQMGYSFDGAVSWDLELGRKRKARIEVAKSQAEYSRLLLQDYLRNLLADASIGYVEALKSKSLLLVQKESYNTMLQLAKSDSVRYKLGDISKITSQQSRLEASSLRNDVYQLEGSLQQSVTALSDFVGNDTTGTDILGDLHMFSRAFVLEDLITQAFNARADLLASKQNINVAASRIKLERANRKIDLGLSLGAGRNTIAINEIAPSPAVTTAKLGVSIPLKFSNSRNADLKIAEMTHAQAEVEYKQIENMIKMEITQAYQQYEAYQKQIQQYDNGMLNEAESILKGITYSYQRGESSILEVLNAQRTYNELRQSYFELLAENAAALIDLERKSGIWDINF